MRRQEYGVQLGGGQMLMTILLDTKDVLLFFGGTATPVIIASKWSTHSKAIQTLQEKVQILQGEMAVQKRDLDRLESRLINHASDFTSVRHLKRSDEEKVERKAAG